MGAGAAGAGAVTVVLVSVLVAEVSLAGAVVSTAVAEDQGQPVVGSGKGDGYLLTHSIFWQDSANIWHSF